MQTPCSRSNCNDCPTRMVCRCLKVTEDVIVDAVNRLGLTTVHEVRAHTGAGDGCTCCHDRIRAFLTDYAYGPAAQEAYAAE